MWTFPKYLLKLTEATVGLSASLWSCMTGQVFIVLDEDENECPLVRFAATGKIKFSG